MRILVRPADPRTRLFVGIVPKDKVEGYLRGTAHDAFAGADLKPFGAAFHRIPGGAGAAAPGAQPFWAATSTGTGDRALYWNKTHGAWSVVVMRMDGSPGLDVWASIGLRFGFLTSAGAGLLAIGALAIAYVPYARRRWRGSGGPSGPKEEGNRDDRSTRLQGLGLGDGRVHLHDAACAQGTWRQGRP